jgi:CheY-like chemotaxis protein
MVRDFPDAYESILMDWEMPVLDGPSAVRQIREMGFSMFIVGITGNMLPEDVLYFQSCGADAVIAKPVRLFELEQLWRDNDVSARLMEA